MTSFHDYCCRTSLWYHRWHNHPHHARYHWSVFIFAVVFTVSFGVHSLLLLDRETHFDSTVFLRQAFAQSIDFAGLKTEYKKYRGGGPVDPICFDNQCNPRMCKNTKSALDDEPCQSDSQCNGRDIDINGVQGICYDNWWEEQIGCPQWLADAIINGITTGPSSNRNGAGGTVNYQQTLQSCSSYRPNPNGAGANGAWLGLGKFSVGLALENTQITLEAAEFMAREPASRYVIGFRPVGGEGITQDWAHYTHQQEMQNHYGTGFLDTMATYMAITKNDPVVRVQAFPGVDPNQSETADVNMCAWVSNHVKWVNHFDPSSGSPYWDPLTSSKFPQSARSRFERGVDKLLNDTNYCSPTVEDEMKGILGQGGLSIGAMSFPIENYLAVKRSNFTAGLRMAELGNLSLEASPVNALFGAVNVVTNATIDKWYGDEDSGGDSIVEYPHRLLGLTTIPRDHAYIVAHNYQYSNGYGDMGAVRNAWPLYSQSTLGGMYAAGGEWLRGGSFNMKKSWFFFDNEIVSLGSEISDSDGIDTWLNSFIKNDANFVASNGTRSVVTRSGRTIDDGAWLSGSDTNFGTISWLYHDNTGYVFPQTERVRARGILTSYRGSMVQTFLSHTEDNDPTYAVVLLPGATQAATQGYNDTQIVELSGNAHVVKEVSSGAVGAVIFSSNYNNPAVSSNLPATIMYRQQGGDVLFSLYNPHLETQTDWWGATCPGCTAVGENPKDDYDVSSAAATKHNYIVKIPLTISGVSPACTGNACSAVSVTSGNTINVSLRVTRKLELKVNGSGQITEAAIGLNDADAGTTTSGGGGNPTCGDGTCNGGETPQSCSTDCRSGSTTNNPPLKPTLTLVSAGGCTPGGSCMVNNCPGTYICQNNQQVCQDTPADNCPITGGGAVCGNNQIESGEACDGTASHNQTCQTRGFTGGTLTCNASGSANQCQFNTSQCSGASSGTANVNPPFPRIGVLYFYEVNVPQEIWKDKDLVAVRYWYPEIAQKIKTAYPDKIVLAANNIIDGVGIFSPETPPNPHAADSWLVPLVGGTNPYPVNNPYCAHGWHMDKHPGNCLYDGTDGAPLLSAFGNKRWNQYLPDYLTAGTNWSAFDGTFWDSWAAGIYSNADKVDLDRNGVADSSTTLNQLWLDSNRRIAENMRATAPAGKGIQIAHESAESEFAYLNGRGFEYWKGKDWQWVYDTVLKPYAQNSVSPKINFIEGQGNATDYQRMRFGLTTAALADAYFYFEQQGTPHVSDYHYDEFIGNLGYPTGQAVQISGKPGVYVRYFDKGAVITNGSGSPQTISSTELTGGPYFRFKGGQDSGFNNGQPFTSVSLAGSGAPNDLGNQTGDGIMLFKQPTTLVSDIIIDNVDRNMTSPGQMPVSYGGSWTQVDMGTLKADVTLGYALLYGWDQYGPPYAKSSQAGATATYQPTINVAGDYNVYVWYPDVAADGQGTACSAVSVSVSGMTCRGFASSVNQSSAVGKWNLIGNCTMNIGSSAYVRLTAPSGGCTTASDAIKFSYTANTLTKHNDADQRLASIDQVVLGERTMSHRRQTGLGNPLTWFTFLILGASSGLAYVFLTQPTLQKRTKRK